MATTVFGGVSKMFCLYQDEDTTVAAVTAGLAIVGGVTIAEQAKRFRRKVSADKRTFNKVEDVANEFKDFMYELWHEDYKKSGIPDIQYFSTVQFIVAGYGRDDVYGRVFRINCSDNSLVEQFTEDDHTGVCWGGTADYAERLLRGSDGLLQYKVNRELVKAMKQQRESTINDLSEAITAAGVVLPSGLDVQVREEQLPTLPWDSVTADVDYGNLSTQYAIDFVELLVNIQSGMQRFARGIPVVGGRTHIGVLKRGERFEMLNEPKLQHKHTGYADEF
ncbi:hypothetical protein B0E50_13890 [Rhodanobacter sp. C01]|nr:hypothetical protein B0E50_13890 [Rhodanobacter sp. C01]